MDRFKVYYDGGWNDCCERSEVYAIDHVRDRFLIVSESDRRFKWVPTEDCKLDEEIGYHVEED